MHKPLTTRLVIEGAEDDVPRAIRAKGRACEGEVVLLMLPRQNQTLFALEAKKAGVSVWVNQSDMLPDGHRPKDPGRSDGPARPTHAVPAEVAVGVIRTMNRQVPKDGRGSLKGTWTGELTCNDGLPVVTLHRKVASYGTIHLTSRPDRKWDIRVERDARWFTPSEKAEAQRVILLDAIHEGIQRLLGLVSEACVVRDTTRRVAVDTEYAKAHPPKPRKEKKDPTESYTPKDAKVSKRELAAKEREGKKAEKAAEKARAAGEKERIAAQAKAEKARLAEAKKAETQQKAEAAKAEKKRQAALAKAAAPKSEKAPKEKKAANVNPPKAERAPRAAKAPSPAPPKAQQAPSPARPSRAVSPPPAATPPRPSKPTAVDPDKDALLMRGFQQAMAVALQQARAEEAG